MKPDDSNAGKTPALNDDKSTASRHGVFYPTGYTVAVFKDSVQADQILNSIEQANGSNDSRLLGPDEMLKLTDESVKGATLLAQIVSAELKQVEILRQFASDDRWFVIFDREKLADELFQSIVVDADPHYMIHYSMLAIENLTTGKNEISQDSPLGMNERGRAG